MYLSIPLSLRQTQHFWCRQFTLWQLYTSPSQIQAPPNLFISSLPLYHIRRYLLPPFDLACFASLHKTVVQTMEWLKNLPLWLRCVRSALSIPPCPPGQLQTDWCVCTSLCHDCGWQHHNILRSACHPLVCFWSSFYPWHLTYCCS